MPFVGGGKGIRGSLAPGKKAKRTKLQFVPFSRKPTTGRMTRGSTNIPKAKVVVVPTPQKYFNCPQSNGNVKTIQLIRTVFRPNTVIFP